MNHASIASLTRSNMRSVLDGHSHLIGAFYRRLAVRIGKSEAMLQPHANSRFWYIACCPETSSTKTPAPAPINNSTLPVSLNPSADAPPS
jgi:hypothetical protein